MRSNPSRDDRFHASQGAPWRPVARTALAVVGTGDDDQRLLRSMPGRWLPIVHDLASGLMRASSRLSSCRRDRHLVHQGRVGEVARCAGGVVAAVRGVGIEVFLRQAHLRQVLAGGAVEQDRVGRRQDGQW